MIRLAKLNELNEILDVYETARGFMRKTGNPTQWNGGYPQREVLIDDINKEQLYVLAIDDEIHGVFAFIKGEDPTYNYIENGSWLAEDEYYAVHRVASAGKSKGVLKTCLDFCKNFDTNLRIDTHSDNKVMQHLLIKNDFVECGTIYLQNGDPRIAFEFINK